MTTRISVLLLIFAFATPAAAQAVVDSTVSDLNGDGLRERFTLLNDGDDSVDMIIEDTGTGRITAPDIAWIGGVGQEPELDLANNGSVRLTSMNESIGRDRWHQTLTIVFRNGAYVIGGFTYEWYDTLAPNTGGSCDLNLLNGKGFTQTGTAPKQPIRHNVAPILVTGWTDDHPIPEICRLWE